MKTPRDQGLFLTVFLCVGLAVILAAWLSLPVYHKEEAEEEVVEVPVADRVRLATPEELIREAQKSLLQAEAALSQIASSEDGKPDKE
jgi:hypothetical protein